MNLEWEAYTVTVEPNCRKKVNIRKRKKIGPSRTPGPSAIRKLGIKESNYLLTEMLISPWHGFQVSPWRRDLPLMNRDICTWRNAYIRDISGVRILWYCRFSRNVDTELSAEWKKDSKDLRKETIRITRGKPIYEAQIFFFLSTARRSCRTSSISERQTILLFTEFPEFIQP